MSAVRIHPCEAGTAWLLSARAVFWEERRALIFADAHWGKSEAFQMAGLPVPSGGLQNDLARLDRALDETGAEVAIALGDLVHAKSAVTTGVQKTVAEWRASRPHLEFYFALGNHDRGFVPPSDWRMQTADRFDDGPFSFTHERESAARFNWSGHYHPIARPRGGGDSLRLPCFWVGEDFAILPAFASFAGGQVARPTGGHALYAIAGEEIIRLKSGS